MYAHPPKGVTTRFTTETTTIPSTTPAPIPSAPVR